MGLTVLQPDVNESFVEFSVVPDSDQIRFGMAAIKNVGTGVVEEILKAREQGSFTSLEDFLTRVGGKAVNRKSMESLIKAGAFDRFGERYTLLHNLDLLLAYSSRLHKQALSGQTDIFGNIDEAVYQKPRLELQQSPAQVDDREHLIWERELLGLYLSQHPLELFETILSEHTTPLNSLTPDHDNKAVSIGGAINDIREITTKNGQKMAFVKLEDLTGEIEIILFPSSYQQTLGLWQRDRVVIVRGKVNARDKEGNQSAEIKIMVDDAREVTSQQAGAYQATGRKAKAPKAKIQKIKKIPAAAKPISERVYIRLDNTSDERVLLSLKQTIDNHQGETEVILVLGEAAKKQAIKLPVGVNRDSDALIKLQELVGADNLVIK